MKLYNLYFAIVAVAMILFVTPSVNAQTSPDSVNGWNFAGTIDATSNVHYTTLSSDHVQGETSQLFGWNVTAWIEGSQYVGVYFEKVLDSTYQAPLAIEYFSKINSRSHNFDPIIGIYIVHGDSVRGGYSATDTQWVHRNEWRWIDAGSPKLFNKIRLQFAISGLDTGQAEILLDSMTLHYAWGDVTLDPFEVPAVFTASPLSVTFDTTTVTARTSSTIMVHSSGSPLPLKVLSAWSTNPMFTVSPTISTIAPDDSAAFNVTFTPTDTGMFNGWILFQHNGVSHLDSVEVTGVCTIPESAMVVKLNLPMGWNLVSLPVDPSQGTAVPDNLFCYTGSYTHCASMVQGKGYWMKVTASPLLFVGTAFPDTVTLDVQQHWNIVGATSVPVAVVDMGSLPQGITTSNFFGYNGSAYFIADTLYPGYAYWVKVSTSGRLMYNHGSTAMAKASFGKIHIVNDGELPPAPPGGYAEATPHPVVPKEFVLAQNFPNPFNPNTRIQYDLPSAGLVKLEIFDIKGRNIRSLFLTHQDVGSHEVLWDGRNDNGILVSTGTYLYRLTINGISLAKKMLVLR